MKPKMSIITLGVNDLEKSVAFYKALGLPLHDEDTSSIAFFALDGTWLSLYPKQKLAEDAHVPVEGSGFSGFTIAHNEPNKEAVNKTFAEAVAAGATVVKEPQEVFWGGYSGYFADPDGYLWEIAWNPFTDLT